MLAARRARRTVALVAAPLMVAGVLISAPGAVAQPGTPSDQLPQAPTPPMGDPDESGQPLARAGSVEEAQAPGEWTISSAGTDTWSVSWTAPKALPLTADRPVVTGPDGAPLATSVAADGATVSAVVEQAEAPVAGDLDVQLSGRVLDASPGTLVSPRAPGLPAKMPAGKRLLAADPAIAGSFPVTSSDYRLAPVKWPSYRQPIEMVGHLVTPTAAAATGSRPLVLFLHGRHSYCYQGKNYSDSTWPCKAPAKEIESQLGYDYLQKRLASQGYATVSIRVNGINAQDDADLDGGAGARAMIVRRHLDHLATTAAAQQIDMSRVILVGHSRGGEGVNRAAIQIPLSAPYRVVGQVLLAPTDFAGQSAPYINTVTVLPSCDGDVSDLQGQQFTDVSRDLLSDDTSMKSSVMVVGANHNFFNTEWTPSTSVAPSDDDMAAPKNGLCGKNDPNRLTAAAQRRTGLALVTGAVKLFASRAEQFAPLFDGSDVRVASTGTAALRSHTLGRGRAVLRPGSQFTLGTPVRGKASYCSGAAMGGKAPGGPACTAAESFAATPHWYSVDYPMPRPKRAARFSWSAAGGAVPLNLSAPLDLTGRRLALRTVVDQAFGQGSIKVKVTDGAGHSALVSPVDGASLRRLPGGRNGAHWAQSVVVDPSGATGVNLADVRSVALVGVGARGGVFVLDLEVLPSAVPSVPVKRAVVVSAGTRSVVEGNGKDKVTAQIPIVVQGTLTAPARIRVTRGMRTTVHTLQPGETSLSVPLSYRPDRVWTGPRDESISIMPDSGAMTDAPNGGLRIREDDPRPQFTVTPLKTSVKEGGTFRVRLGITHPMGTAAYVNLMFRPVKGREMSVSDIDTRGFDVYGGDRRLSKAEIYRSVRIPRGKTSAVLTLRVKRDQKVEGREKARLVLEFSDIRGKTKRRSVVFTAHDR